MAAYHWKYEIEVKEESGNWSFVSCADTAAQAYRLADKYQGKSGCPTRVVKLGPMLERQDFVQLRERRPWNKGLYQSRDRRYRLRNFDVRSNGGWDKWWIEKLVDGQWKLIAKGPSMKFLISTYAHNQ